MNSEHWPTCPLCLDKVWFPSQLKDIHTPTDGFSCQDAHVYCYSCLQQYVNKAYQSKNSSKTLKCVFCSKKKPLPEIKDLHSNMNHMNTVYPKHIQINYALMKMDQTIYPCDSLFLDGRPNDTNHHDDIITTTTTTTNGIDDDTQEKEKKEEESSTPLSPDLFSPSPVIPSSSCTSSCTFKGNQFEMFKHKKECDWRQVHCLDCQQSVCFRNIRLSHHHKECTARTKCSICKQYILKKEWGQHLHSIHELYQCSWCKVLVRKGGMKEHKERRCSEKDRLIYCPLFHQCSHRQQYSRLEMKTHLDTIHVQPLEHLYHAYQRMVQTIQQPCYQTREGGCLGHQDAIRQSRWIIDNRDRCEGSWKACLQHSRQYDLHYDEQKWISSSSGSS